MKQGGVYRLPDLSMLPYAGVAKERTETAFRNSFGLPTDLFPLC